MSFIIFNDITIFVKPLPQVQSLETFKGTLKESLTDLLLLLMAGRLSRLPLT